MLGGQGGRVAVRVARQGQKRRAATRDRNRQPCLDAAAEICMRMHHRKLTSASATTDGSVVGALIDWAEVTHKAAGSVDAAA